MAGDARETEIQVTRGPAKNYIIREKFWGTPTSLPGMC